MIQKKMADYKPRYPKKALAGMAMAAAALVAITGCEPSIQGAVQIAPVEETAAPCEVTESGYVAIEPTKSPDEELVLSGDVMIDDTANEAVQDDEPSIAGKIMIPSDNP